jgi:hypothetical protein
MTSPIHAATAAYLEADRVLNAAAAALNHAESELDTQTIWSLREHFNPAHVFTEGLAATVLPIALACRWDAEGMEWSAMLRLALDEPNFESVLTWRRSGDCPATVVQAVIAELCDFAWSTQRADLAPRIESLNATIWKAT